MTFDITDSRGAALALAGCGLRPLAAARVTAVAALPAADNYRGPVPDVRNDDERRGDAARRPSARIRGRPGPGRLADASGGLNLLSGARAARCTRRLGLSLSSSLRCGSSSFTRFRHPLKGALCGDEATAPANVREPPVWPADRGPASDSGSSRWSLDVILVGIVGVIIELTVNNNLAGLVSLAIGVTYYGWLEGSPSAQTIPSRTMGDSRLRPAAGRATCARRRAMGRYFARWLSTIPCLFGYFWMLWDKEKQF